MVLLQILFVAGAKGQGNNGYANSSYSTDLPNSARIIFVGNSLVEEAGQYGILEWMFLNAWPDKNLTFRNLGWSGDTADGRARSYISRPPEPYDLLVQQIDTLNPDLVVVGYGGVEAYEGEPGLEEFGENLDRLVKDIDSLGAQSILLSTVPQVVNENMNVDVSLRNNNLKLYSEKIREISELRDKKYVDLFSVMSALGKEVYTGDGIHLNSKGYYRVGEEILNNLGYKIPGWTLTLDARNKETMSTTGLEVVDEHISRTGIELKIKSTVNPVIVDKVNILERKLVVKGLKRGIYNLAIDGENILAASSSDFAEGVIIDQGELMDKARDIQNKYREINELYFWEYRPLNRTYLVGFRRYEQGQNSYELEVNSTFIDRLEKKIFQMKSAGPESFSITRIK